MRHYYRYLLLDGLNDLIAVRQRVSVNPLLGSAIYHLATCLCWGGIPGLLRELLVNAPNLVHLTSGDNREALLDYQTLVILAAKAGSTLQTLTGHAIARATSPKSPRPLYAFTALRALDWYSTMRLKSKCQAVPVDSFPCLEWLTFVSSNDTFLELPRCITLVRF
ncbi:hypothetical protein H2248_002805 [Termitomyces sp. 'cryptogamus']|nr:hypothetical protein H2248_002805 [Termitomyces sp. 'cryptogamus']